MMGVLRSSRDVAAVVVASVGMFDGEVEL